MATMAFLMRSIEFRLRNLMHLEMIPREARDFAGIGQNPDWAVTHRDGLCLAIAFPASFVIVIELRGWGKRAHADMYSNAFPAARKFFAGAEASSFYGLERSQRFA